MYLVKHYVNGNTLQHEIADEILEEFSKELSMVRGKCIDIGSGPGDITKQLLLPRLQSNVEVVGADISPIATDYANLHYADHKRLSFVTLDIESTDLPSEQREQYDCAVSFSCLHWCHDLRKAFGNIYKLLRPGGKAVIEFIAHHDSYEKYYEISRRPQYKPYIQKQDVDRFVPQFQYCKNPRASLRKILEDIGFKVVHCSVREKTYNFKNREILREHLVPVCTFTSNIPEDMKNRFIDDLIDEIILINQITNPRKKKQGNDAEEELFLKEYYNLVTYIKKPQTASVCVKCNMHLETYL